MADGSIEYWHHEYGGFSGVIIFGILFISFTSIIILIFNNIHKKVIAKQKAGYRLTAVSRDEKQEEEN